MLCQTRLYYTKLCVDLHQNTCGRQPSQVIPKPEKPEQPKEPSRKHSKTIEKTKKNKKTKGPGLIQGQNHRENQKNTKKPMMFQRSGVEEGWMASHMSVRP